MPAGFLWTDTSGGSRVLLLFNPMLVREGGRLRPRASFRAVSLDQRTVVTEEIEGNAEVLVGDVRFVNVPDAFLDMLDAGRAGQILTYRPELEFAFDDYPAILEHSAISEVIPDRQRYGGNEWQARLTLRRVDGGDWSLWSQVGVTTILQATRNASFTPSVGASVLGTFLGSPVSGWRGGVLAHNGLIYGIPHDAVDVLVIDPVFGEQQFPILTTLIGPRKWSGGVLGPDGLIYAIPYDATEILIIDPSTNTVEETTMGVSLTGTAKWQGGVLAPTGLIYGIPYNSTDVLIINPVAGTATRSDFGSPLTGTGKWVGGVLGHDNRIYGMPHNSTNILILNPLTGSLSLATLGASLTGTGKWFGGSLGPDGKIYGIPDTSADILVIDVEAGTALRSNFGVTMSGIGKWAGSALGGDARIYGMPFNADDVLIIDTNTGIVSRSDLGLSSELMPPGKLQGGVAALTNVYGIPADFNVLKVAPRGAGLPKSVMLSAHLNKL